MRAHAEAVGDGLEILLLLVDAVAASPPPGLMDKGSVGGIHESDDSVINVDRHFGLQVGEFVFTAEFLDLRSGIKRLRGRAETRARRGGIGNVHPYEIVLLLAGITAGVDAIHPQLLV